MTVTDTVPAGIMSALEAFAISDANLRRRDEVYPAALAELAEASASLAIDPAGSVDADIAALRAADDLPSPPRPLIVGSALQLDVVLPPPTAALIASIAVRLLWIEDLAARAVAAGEVMRTAEYRLGEAPAGAEDWERYELIRGQRDMACLVLLAPYLRVWRRKQRALRDAEADLNEGRIKRPAHAKRVEAINAQFTSDLRAAEQETGLRRLYRPMAVARMAGVSRGLVNDRVMKREPDHLDVGWTIAEAEARAARAGAIVRRWTILQLVGQQIRNEAVDDLLSGRDLTGGNPDGRIMTNTEIQELLGITSARASQLRHGAR